MFYGDLDGGEDKSGGSPDSDAARIDCVEVGGGGGARLDGGADASGGGAVWGGPAAGTRCAPT